MVDDVMVGAVDGDDCAEFVFVPKGTGKAAPSSVVGAGALSPTSWRVIAASEAVFPANPLSVVGLELSSLARSMMKSPTGRVCVEQAKARVAKALVQMWTR